MKPHFRIAAVLLYGLSLSAAADFSATLDRDQVAPGETVTLTLQRDSHGGGDPDLDPLKKDFDVLDRSSGSSIQIVNGSMSSQRQLRLTLAPKHAGKIQVPPLSWDGEQSQPLELTVADSGAASQGGGAGAGTDSAAAGQGSSHVFLTSSLDQAQPYVQGAVLLTVLLHTDEPLIQAGLEFSGNGDILEQPIGKDRQSSETRNGRPYQVIERQYLLQPQRSGQLSLDGPTLEAQVADASMQSPFGADPFGHAFGGSPFAGMMQATRPLRLHGDAIKLNVRPRPATATGPDWLPAQQVTLEEAWRPDSGSIHAGEPLTLHLRLVATGLSAAQLPDLSAELSLPDGIKAYPDQAKLDTSLQSDQIVGSREQDIALIAARPGQYRIPALHLSWWDTRQETQREVVLPERSLDVAPAAAGAGAATSAPPPVALAPAAPQADAAVAGPVQAAPAAARSLPWPWISLVLGLLWLGTVAIWWRQRRAAAKAPAPNRVAAARTAPDAGPAKAAFRQACLDDDPHAARRNLLAWAAATWPQHAPAGLNALAEQLHEPALTALLQQLDRACYSGGAWHGAELARVLSALPAAAKSVGKPAQLAELYP